MKLSIIITSYNTRGLTRQLLKGLRHFPPSLPYEIIVVDNDSKDGSQGMITREFPEVHLQKLKENKGLAFGNNVGIQKSTGEYLLILNPDIAIFEGTIDLLINKMDNLPQAGIIAPRLLNPDKSLQYSTFKFPRWYTPLLRRTPLGRLPRGQKYLQSYIMKQWDHNDSRLVDWVLGAVMLIRRSALDVVGLQDESFFLYFEDVDWCRRFWEKRWEVWYIHDVAFIHYHRRESAEYPGATGIVSPATKIHIKSWITYLKKYS